MRDGAQRRPGAVPDDPAEPDGPGVVPVDVRRGADTDDDGRPDTLLAPDGADLLVLTDVDGDGLADRVLRIGPDGGVHAEVLGHPPPQTVPGSARAHGPWGELLDRVFGSPG